MPPEKSSLVLPLRWIHLDFHTSPLIPDVGVDTSSGMGRTQASRLTPRNNSPKAPALGRTNVPRPLAPDMRL